MRAGRMDTRLTLQQRTAGSADSAGNPSTTWTDTETVWAAREQFGGTEEREGGQMHGELTGVFRIRHRSSVVPKDYRAVDADSTGTVYDIQAAFDPDGRNEETHLEVIRRGV